MVEDTLGHYHPIVLLIKSQSHAWSFWKIGTQGHILN